MQYLNKLELTTQGKSLSWSAKSIYAHPYPEKLKTNLTRIQDIYAKDIIILFYSHTSKFKLTKLKIIREKLWWKSINYLKLSLIIDNKYIKI